MRALHRCDQVSALDRRHGYRGNNLSYRGSCDSYLKRTLYDGIARIESSAPETAALLQMRLGTATLRRVDVGYRDCHQALAEFVRSLANEIDFSTVDLATKLRTPLVTTLRDNSTPWRDADALDEMTFHDLVIAPTFLPEPHDEYSTNAVVQVTIPGLTSIEAPTSLLSRVAFRPNKVELRLKMLP